MGSEDVLGRFAAMKRTREEHWGILSVDLQRLWELTCDLAAEVRELRAVQPSFDAYRETHKDDMEAMLRLQAGLEELRAENADLRDQISVMIRGLAEIPVEPDSAPNTPQL